MKKMNNEGFSLVELVIVIAIMAVLMAILAPQLLKYVDDSRRQKDESALDEILNATHIALSVDKVYNEAKAEGVRVTISNNAKISATSPALEEELLKLVPDEVVFQSKTYVGRGGETIDITFSDPHGTFILETTWDSEEE